MDVTILRTYGAIITSVLVVVLVGAVGVFAYATHDQSTMQIVAGAVVAQFATVVGFWVGSSISSQQKDEALSKRVNGGPEPK